MKKICFIIAVIMLLACSVHKNIDFDNDPDYVKIYDSNELDDYMLYFGVKGRDTIVFVGKASLEGDKDPGSIIDSHHVVSYVNTQGLQQIQNL